MNDYDYFYYILPYYKITYLDLYLFEKREFNITIQKQDEYGKEYGRFISLYLEVFKSFGPLFDNASASENNTPFEPIYKEIKDNNKSYIVFYFNFVRNITLNLNLYINQSEISKFTSTTINITNITVENLSNDKIICPDKIMSFYQMSVDSFEYYILSFKKDNNLYFYKNNTNKEEKINSGEIGKITDDPFYSDKEKGQNCFSIKYTDEKNTIKEDDFTITLFEPSSYNFTINNIDINIKTIQIKFKEDKYFNISKFSYNDISINSYLFENYYYYHFNHEKSEIAIHLEFKNISNIDSLKYQTVQFSYQPLSYSLKDIEDDYKNNLTGEEMYKINPKKSKQKVYIAHNSSVIYMQKDK